MSGFWSRLRAARRAFRGQPEVDASMPPFQQDQPRQGGYTVPPGTRPVVVDVHEASIDGVPDTVFRKVEGRFKGECDSEYALHQIHRVRLTGCGCYVLGPNDVAYLSEISGMPVCRRCAAICICGHKVAPSERVLIERRTFICKVCHEEQQHQLRWARIRRFLFGPFIKES